MSYFGCHGNKKHIQYDSHSKKTTGFVDLGDGTDENTEASEALVFIVVGLQGHWKAPIGYFFTRTLSAESQKGLLVYALKALHERGIKVVCLTMDGHATNVSMCTMLGCQLKLNIEPLKPYFAHPSTGELVFVIMDACHMLKLTRNMLQAYSSINSPSGQISWKYITDLNDVQQKEGLHAANKVTSM